MCEQDYLSIFLCLHFLQLVFGFISLLYLVSYFHFSPPCFSRQMHSLAGVAPRYVGVRAYTGAGGVINHFIHNQGKFPLPPQKSEQTELARTHIHTCEFLAGGFGGTGHSFLSPITPWCFIVSYPRGVTCISVPVFLCSCASPPPSVNPDRKEVPVGFECDSTGKSVSCRHSFY